MQALKFLIVFALAATAWADSGSITVYNSGGYVATFSVSYTLNGERKTETTPNYTLGYSKTIEIPDGATDIRLNVEKYWFIASKNTIFTRYYDGPVQKCFKIWGTALNAESAEQAC